MTGILVAPDLQRSFSISSDWIELLALARPEQFATDGDVLQPNDLLEDRAAPTPDDLAVGPSDDPDIIDVAAEPALDAVFEELAYRQSVLGEAYPFNLEIAPRRLLLTVAPPSDNPRIEQGRQIYLACLYISAIRAGILDASAADLVVDPAVGRLFQICATIAAAGYMSGEAYWFGHPRPDETTLLQAISTLAGLLRQGSAASQPPPGETRFAKDGGVDVVAWRDHPDGQPAKLILYGQCASGMNWDGKPVAPKVQRLDSYYTLSPSRHWLPALITPFPLYMDRENAHRIRDEEARGGFYRQIEAEMGIIIDRLRVVRWAMEALNDVQPAVRAAVDRLDEVFAWSEQARDAARLPG